MRKIWEEVKQNVTGKKWGVADSGESEMEKRKGRETAGQCVENE